MQTDELIEEQAAVELSDYEKERGKPMPNLSHGVLEAAIAIGFGASGSDRYRVAIELTLEFVDGLVLTPDISVLPKRPIDWGREPARCRDLPVMVVEILSPSQGYATAVEKIDAYFARGVQSVWEINPALRLVAIHRPGEQRPPVIQQGEARDPATGLSVRLEAIFS